MVISNVLCPPHPPLPTPKSALNITHTLCFPVFEPFHVQVITQRWKSHHRQRSAPEPHAARRLLILSFLISRSWWGVSTPWSCGANLSPATLLTPGSSGLFCLSASQTSSAALSRGGQRFSKWGLPVARGASSGVSDNKENNLLGHVSILAEQQGHGVCLFLLWFSQKKKPNPKRNQRFLPKWLRILHCDPSMGSIGWSERHIFFKAKLWVEM